MTTPHKFFQKLFEENDKVINSYKTYDFLTMSPQETSFLSNLSIITRYKSFLRNYLTKVDIKEIDKKAYIDIYKPCLTYNEYITYNLIHDKMEESAKNILQFFAGINIVAYIFFIARRPVDTSLVKDMTRAVIATTLFSYGVHRYNRREYSRGISEIYLGLSDRLNKFPELKHTENNNLLTEEDLSDDE